MLRGDHPRISAQLLTHVKHHNFNDNKSKILTHDKYHNYNYNTN